jgi:hypothetical protein
MPTQPKQEDHCGQPPESLSQMLVAVDMLDASSNTPSDGKEEGWQGELRAGAVTSSISLLLGQGFSFLTAQRPQCIMLAHGAQWLP